MSDRPDPTMRAWTVTGAGAPTEVLERRDLDVPEPGPGLVRLRVAAAALGLPDVFMCHGTYPLTPPLPFTPGQEIVGTVDAVGPDVDPTLLGTRQMGVTAFYLGAGGFADAALAATRTVFPAPDLLDDVAAAGFHIPFQTAWNALVDRGRVAAGDDLVVLGASGGSGSAAVLLGRALGARVIAVAGGADKAAFCAGLGADDVIDHHDTDLVTVVRDLTGGRGADAVFDPVGGAVAEALVVALANHGRLLLVGFASGRWATVDPARLVRANASVLGVYAGAYDRAHVLDVYAQLLALIDEGRLGAIPTTVVGFDDLPAALEALADRTATGKTVLRFTDV